MPMFTHKQHVTAVNNELKETSLGLDKKAKKHLLKAMTKLMEDMTFPRLVPWLVNVPREQQQ